MTISHRSLRISDLLLLKFFKLYIAFLIDIIDNIIMYSLYSLYYVTRTSTNGSEVYRSRDTDRDTWQIALKFVAFGWRKMALKKVLTFHSEFRFYGKKIRKIIKKFYYSDEFLNRFLCFLKESHEAWVFKDILLE